MMCCGDDCFWSILLEFLCPFSIVFPDSLSVLEKFSIGTLLNKSFNLSSLSVPSGHLSLRLDMDTLFQSFQKL